MHGNTACPPEETLGYCTCAEVAGCTKRSTPPPPVRTRARFWFREQRRGDTGLRCLKKAVLPDRRSGIEKEIICDYKRVPNRPAQTPEHKGTWSYTHANTLTPTWTLPAGCTTLQTTFSIGAATTTVPQKGPKVQKHGVAVFGHVRVRTGGGGGAKLLCAICSVFSRICEGIRLALQAPTVSHEQLLGTVHNMFAHF